MGGRGGKVIGGQSLKNPTEAILMLSWCKVDFNSRLGRLLESMQVTSFQGFLELKSQTWVRNILSAL